MRKEDACVPHTWVADVCLVAARGVADILGSVIDVLVGL